MPRKKYTHVHQYHRTYPAGQVGRFKGKGQWECALPDCTHYIPGNMSDPVGKLSACNECGEHFILDEQNMMKDNPVCGRCANPGAIRVADLDIDLERYTAKSTIATKTGKAMVDITEDEIDRMVQFLRLKGE